MRRSCDRTGCGKHGGGTQRNPNRTRHRETMEEGKEVSIKLDMIDMVVEYKKNSIKLNVVEEDEEPPPPNFEVLKRRIFIKVVKE